MCNFQRTKEERLKCFVSIHQCFDADVFDKISKVTSSKEDWNMIEKYYGCDAKVKKVQLQPLTRQYEMSQMK